MIGTWLMLACVAGACVLGLRAWWAWSWHHRGGGRRAAYIAYARMRRDRVDTAETRLREAEFVRYHVASRPGATRYLLAALLLLLIGLPTSCALMGGWPWN